MAVLAFKNEAELDQEKLDYYLQEAEVLAARDESAIRNYVDREINNPDLIEVLESDDSASLDDNEGIHEELNLNFEQGKRLISRRQRRRLARLKSENRFKSFRKKVRAFVCKIVSETKETVPIDWKDVIKTLLLAGATALGIAFPVVAIPIAIGMIAIILRRGFNALCEHYTLTV